MSQQPCLPIPIKRKRNDDVDDDHQQLDNNTIGRIAFDDVNSMDASEYLQRVMQEARTIGDETLIATSQSKQSTRSKQQQQQSPNPIIIDGSVASIQYLVSHPTQHIQPVPFHLRQLHEAKWIKNVMDQFENLRQYIEFCHQNGIGGKEHRKVLQVPPMKDTKGWIQFCTGLIVCDEWNTITTSTTPTTTPPHHNDDDHTNQQQDEVQNHTTTTTKMDVPITSSSSSSLWKQSLPSVGYHEPSVQLLCQLDQVMIRRILAHFTLLLPTTTTPKTTTTIPVQYYKWLYALMVRLEKPIHPQDAATLRKIVLNVAAERLKLTTTNTSSHSNTMLAAMNLILVIAGLYFGQGKYQELFPNLS